MCHPNLVYVKIITMTNIFEIIRRWLAVVILFVLLFAFFYFKLYQYLSYDALKKYHLNIQAWTNQHYQQAVLLYFIVFILSVACAIPSATFLSIVGGFLFGNISTFYAVLGTTLGGFILFLAVKTALGGRIVRRSRGWMKGLERNINENAFHYILTLRFIPIMPCGVINITAGVLNVPAKTFLAATVIGIFPSTLIYTMLGHGLNEIFLADHIPNLWAPSILIPLLGLAFISILPIVYRKLTKRKY